MSMRSTMIAIGATATFSVVGSQAHADKVIADVPQQLQQAKISLVQAVIAAERYSNGRAERAEFGLHKRQWVYDIEVVKGDKTINILVDAGKGTIISDH